jgi:hypothetical protein
MFTFCLAEVSMPAHCGTDSTSRISSQVATTRVDSRSDLLPTMTIGGEFFADDERAERVVPHVHAAADKPGGVAAPDEIGEPLPLLDIPKPAGNEAVDTGLEL